MSTNSLIVLNPFSILAAPNIATSNFPSDRMGGADLPHDVGLVDHQAIYMQQCCNSVSTT